MDSYPLDFMYPIAKISPEQFEMLVLRKFKESYPHADFTHRENISGVDGEYNIDLAIRFEELGVNFLVLVECKYHKNPIKRDYIQILKDKVESIGAQKGIIISSSSFQLGAINYAKAHNIALIRLINDEFIYERRCRDFTNKIKVPGILSGNVSMKWIESTGETSLTSKIIDNFNEVLVFVKN
ncbi:restriction endonuclease [Cohnella luojiensis]|uniref:Restriction endonuclease n=1 Tax=Cohnella luojiensis TaxID=652876 RepID=A0A4Y8LTQ8_9BACL|nr:restriction endonuclease [Cohnella luojiensis]TFE19431.1 restriction endonuclease [Cohnella luojiensis]